jgi:hypothetical protein
MFHMTRNSTNTGTPKLLSQLRARFPAGWSVARRASTSNEVDVVLRLRGPDGQWADVAIECRKKLDPRDVPAVALRMRQGAGPRAGLVYADFLSPRTRELLEREGLSFADGTGNLRLTLSRPAVFIESEGAERDPSPAPRSLKTLKGRAAGRSVRALCDFAPPYGIRELAQRSRTALGSLARVAALLDREALVVRDDSGRITDVKVADLIRRWSRDYGLVSSNAVTRYLAPRGLESVEARLRTMRGQWCLTGSVAARRRAATAASRLGVIYAGDVERLAEHCDLRLASDTAANVLVASPYDQVVFERTWTEDGLTFAALPQVAVDLLTSPGRGPAEGQELMAWMESHGDHWRA